ncbi:hypothetical protein TgHK011_005711 [Trichoderma gracile]|nr:hypothetical protein TgHK011_005711 [Trichoderma gracile]
MPTFTYLPSGTTATAAAAALCTATNFYYREATERAWEAAPSPTYRETHRSLAAQRRFLTDVSSKGSTTYPTKLSRRQRETHLLHLPLLSMSCRISRPSSTIVAIKSGFLLERPDNRPSELTLST